MAELEVREVTTDQAPLAAGVLARGMLDSPLQWALRGDDPLLRLEGLQARFAVMLGGQQESPLGVWYGPCLVGVCVISAPGTCVASLAKQLPDVARPFMEDEAELAKFCEWINAWAERDLRERHWHLGPVAVDRGLQGRGVGSQMMSTLCERMDGEGEIVYLETERQENVPFYERFGFEVVGQAEVLGIQNWFMRRDPPGAT